MQVKREGNLPQKHLRYDSYKSVMRKVHYKM